MKSEKKAGVRPRKLKKVNTVMWAYFCLLGVLLIILIDAVFCILVSSTLENQARDRIISVGGEVQDEISRSDAHLEDRLSRYMSEGITVYVVNQDGLVVIPSDESGLSDERISELKDKLSGQSLKRYITYRSGGRVNYAVKVELNGAENFVLLSYSLDIISRTVGYMQIYLISVSVGVLIFAFVVAYGFSLRLTRGLKDMIDSAEKLSEGDYSVHFHNVDYVELAKLSDNLNQVKDEVKKSGDFQREILANVTHDLKTPLTMIKAYASMIQEISGDDPEKRNRHLQVIIDEADRLTGLVNDVLSVSKVNSNLGKLNVKVFNITDFLYGIINKFGYLQERYGYTFMTDIDANLYTCADEEKIGQVFYNLLSNAVGYTGEDKTVFISLKQSMDGTRIKFSVRDTGNGISEEDMPNIWDRYYRVGETHNRPVKGTGLGLNIVKVILKNHSFDFGVESSVGNGSTFWVDFPSVPSEEK